MAEQADSTLVAKVKLLLHELAIGDDITVDDAIRQVDAELTRIEITPDANYDRAMRLAIRAWDLLAPATKSGMGEEWLDKAHQWRIDFGAEMLYGLKEQI